MLLKAGLSLRRWRTWALIATNQIGLLSKDNDAQLSFAYKLYKSNNPDSGPIAAGFKRTFCRSVPIEFIGVWYVFQVHQSFSLTEATRLLGIRWPVLAYSLEGHCRS